MDKKKIEFIHSTIRISISVLHNMHDVDPSHRRGIVNSVR